MKLREHPARSSSGVQPTPVSRWRILVRGVVYAIGGAVAGRMLGAHPALADNKLPKSQAGYQESPKGDNRCEKCVQFQPPGSCKLVEGVISPSGYCNYFARKPG